MIMSNTLCSLSCVWCYIYAHILAYIINSLLNHIILFYDIIQQKNSANDNILPMYPFTINIID